jgi:hypothetical protein
MNIEEINEHIKQIRVILQKIKSIDDIHQQFKTDEHTKHDVFIPREEDDDYVSISLMDLNGEFTPTNSN